MNKKDYFVNIPIAILLPFFFTKLSDVIMGQAKIKEMCSKLTIYHPYQKELTNVERKEYDIKKAKYDECLYDKRELQDKNDTIKFIILMITGIIAIIVAIQMEKRTPSAGIGIGGILTILYATFVYWNQMAEILKLSITGIVLSGLIYFSYVMYPFEDFKNIENYFK